MGGADAFVALVDAHSPPPRDAFIWFGDLLGEGFDFGDGLSALRGDNFGGVGFDEFLKVFEAFGLGEGVVVETVVANDAVGEGVEESEVGLGGERDVASGHLSRLGAARVENDDFRVALVAHDALPHDGMSDGGVGTDEDEGVGFFEVGVGVRGGVEAEGLFVGNDGGGHALAGVAVAVFDAHSELGKGA